MMLLLWRTNSYIEITTTVHIIRHSVPQARPDRPKKDQNNKHDGRPSRRGQNSQVDKDRHENRRITPSGRDVRRGNGKKEKDSDRSGGSNKSNSKERTAVRMRTV